MNRKLLVINGLLGIALTLLVAALDHFDQLKALERWFYDRRALDCQFFRKPPSGALVHVDIDEGSIESVGKWPWRRSVLAQLVDEISAVGPKLIALDIRLTDRRQPTEIREADGSVRLVGDSDDAMLAASLRRAGCVLVPASFPPEDVPAATPLETALVRMLREDLELLPEEAERRLGSQGIAVARERAFNDKFLSCRRRAMFERISEALARSDDSKEKLREKLLPHSDPLLTSFPLLRLLDDEYERVTRLRPLLRFSRPVEPQMPPLFVANKEELPLTEFGREAAASAFVDYMTSDDGKVRQLPLLILHHDRVYPQMGVVIACRVLGVDPNGVRVTGDRVEIAAGDRTIAIPISTRVHTSRRTEVGAIVDIPYFGGRVWETMYDHPRRSERLGHVPINLVWRIVQTRQALISNNASTDRALRKILPDLDPSLLQEYEKRLPPPEDTESRTKMVDSVFPTLRSFIEEFRKIEKPTPEETAQREFFESADEALRAVPKQNQRLADQLNRYRDELRQKIEGKAVLLGSVAGGMAYDFVPTPLHEKCPGVVVHGVIADSILTGQLLRRAPLWITHLITVAIGLATTMLVLFLSPWKAAVSAFSLAAAYFAVNGVLLYDYYHTIVGVAGPVVAMGVTWSSCQLVEILVEQAERRRITRRFRQYVDPALVQFVVAHPELNVMSGQEREMTVVFTDLAGFTTISETLKEKVVPLLNEYLGLMVTIIRKHNGYVNKFLGDGIMFFYNAPLDNPNHAADAVATVLEMQQALVGFNEGLVRRGLPAITMRAGITTGPMVVGDAGSPDGSDYTVLGDNVNLAARLESANKATGTKVMMTARTASMLGEAFLVRPIARLQVKGKSEGVDTCELIARADSATEQQRRMAGLSRAVFEAFVRGDFAACVASVEELEAAFGVTKLTALYRETAEEYLKQPPEGFNGQIVLHEK